MGKIVKKISLRELSGKNLNFLFGSGASVPYLPTLYINEYRKSLEEIFTELEVQEKDGSIAYYYWQKFYWDNILSKGSLSNVDLLTGTEKEKYFKVKNEYEIFMKNTIRFLNYQNDDHSAKVNIFTTNYDMFFEKVADDLNVSQATDFILNDGSRGFIQKNYSVSNYDKTVYKTGVFGRTHKKIPTINLYKIHGSLSWRQGKNAIAVDYSCPAISMKEVTTKNNDKFEVNSVAYSSTTKLEDIGDQELIDSKNNYNMLKIVNPTKKKFEDTILDENYFHQIRSFTYELERDNSVLIAFGFSFADEHIREIIKRSLSNNSLQIFIFVYSESEYNDNFKNSDSNKFLLDYDNVSFILPEDNGAQNFKIFNSKLYTRSEA